MRHFLIKIIIVCIVFFFLFPVAGQAVNNISSHNGVLLEQETGDVLFEKDAHQKQSVASITKVMTAIVALEYGDLTDEVKISERAIYTEGSAIYLAEDDSMSLEDLIYGLMLRSGNDAATAISEHIGGSAEGFAFLMNEKASAIGMVNSHFMNPHGLEQTNHYSTAYDIALLMRYAMENTTFQKISGTKSYISKNRTYHWRNKNKLLTTLYEKSTGGKTGFTKKAGRTLVTTAADGDLELIVVTLNGPDDWNDHIALFEWGFAHYEWQPFVSEGIPFINDDKQLIKSSTEQNVSAVLPINETYLDTLIEVIKHILRINPHG